LKLKEVENILKQPQTKLAKAMEELEAVAERKEDPERSDAKSRSNDNIAEARLQETIEQLKSQIAEDKIKAEMEAKDKERINAELELLKYDDEAAREQRIKRVSNSLIVSIPAVMADVQKYIAEKEHYDSKTIKSLDDSLDTLINYLKPLYA
jgi:molecular chaperone GrpE (heat shock protein)